MIDYGSLAEGYTDALWLVFLLIGALATTLPRASFIVLGERFRLPGHLQRALRYAPAAALAAIVVPDVLLVGGQWAPVNPKLAAALVVLAVVWRWRNPWLPFLCGMGTLLLLRVGLGWG